MSSETYFHVLFSHRHAPLSCVKIKRRSTRLTSPTSRSVYWSGAVHSGSTTALILCFLWSCGTDFVRNGKRICRHFISDPSKSASCSPFRFTGQQLGSRCDVRKEAAPAAALSGPLHLPQPPQEQVPVRLWRHHRLDWPSGGFSTPQTDSLWMSRLCHLHHCVTPSPHSVARFGLCHLIGFPVSSVVLNRR